MEPIIAEIEKKVTSLIASDPSLFVVDIRIKPTNNIKIFIDGDKGVGIDQLTQYNRRLYRQLEEENMFPGNRKQGWQKPYLLATKMISTGRLSSHTAIPVSCTS